jgi:hypothetical protein
MRAVSGECGERIHPGISQIENRSNVKRSVIRETPTGKYERHKKTK